MADMIGSLATDYKRCGKPNCRCAEGQQHGPYYSRRWRDSDGRQRRRYVPRDQAAAVRAALEEARANTPAAHMRELRRLEKLLWELEGGGKQARQAVAEEQGRHWHGRVLRERRSLPATVRDRATYRTNRAGVVTAVGWEITEDDYVELQRMIRAERKRRNRLGQPWRVPDPGTGAEVLAVEVDLMRLPSYRACVGRGHRGGER